MSRLYVNAVVKERRRGEGVEAEEGGYRQGPARVQVPLGGGGGWVLSAAAAAGGTKAYDGGGGSGRGGGWGGGGGGGGAGEGGGRRTGGRVAPWVLPAIKQASAVQLRRRKPDKRRHAHSTRSAGQGLGSSTQQRRSRPGAGRLQVAGAAAAAAAAAMLRSRRANRARAEGSSGWRQGPSRTMFPASYALAPHSRAKVNVQRSTERTRAGQPLVGSRARPALAAGTGAPPSPGVKGDPGDCLQCGTADPAKG
ncbi:hypothetical protein BDZ91DRAFT_764374 [Kalaharituber pfeilii]|nr:hypothetical protein BDZ91DRAFT_764374 [Kalaharituber pfeilii]